MTIAEKVSKVCSGCTQEYALDFYHKSRKESDGRVSICKNCARQKAALWRAENPERARQSSNKSYHKNKHKPSYYEKSRRRSLRISYGITPEDYQKMLARCGGQCEICEAPVEGELHQVLVVDHCHNSGSVRGLLCRQCNIGLGAFKDDITFLGKAISYLRDRETK